MRGPQPQSHVTLLYRGHVTNRKRSISIFTRSMDPKLRIRGPHLRRHVTHRLRGHVTNQNLCISTFTGHMDPKLSWVVS